MLFVLRNFNKLSSIIIGEIQEKIYTSLKCFT
mgnify:CR=1 FL=1